MKKSYVAIGILIGLLIVGGVTYAFWIDQNKDSQQEANTSNTSADQTDTATPTTKAMTEDDGMAAHGAYVTLADYEANPTDYADTTRVYFFHASWCPICQSIEKEIQADMTKIPVGVTMIKTDFDSSTDLRQKYGVTTQYTFVQVDSNDTETGQWSASSLDAAVAGITL